MFTSSTPNKCHSLLLGLEGNSCTTFPLCHVFVSGTLPSIICTLLRELSLPHSKFCVPYFLFQSPCLSPISISPNPIVGVAHHVSFMRPYGLFDTASVTVANSLTLFPYVDSISDKVDFIGINYYGQVRFELFNEVCCNFGSLAYNPE